jgi:hypothetical protein
LFRRNRQVDAQGGRDKGGKARISGKLRRELKMSRKKEVVETQSRQTDREQAGAAPPVETTNDNREVEAGRRGARNPGQQSGNGTYGRCKEKAPKSRGDPHPQGNRPLGCFSGSSELTISFCWTPAGADLTHEKYPQEKTSDALARIKHRAADRELPCHLRLIQAGGDTVFESGYVLHSDLSSTGTRLLTDTKLSGPSSFTLAR